MPEPRASAVAAIAIVALRLGAGVAASCGWAWLGAVGQRHGLFLVGPCSTPGGLAFYMLLPVVFVVVSWLSGGLARRLVLGTGD